MVWVRLRFDKNSIKPVYKTPVQIRFDSLVLMCCRHVVGHSLPTV